MKRNSPEGQISRLSATDGGSTENQYHLCLSPELASSTNSSRSTIFIDPLIVLVERADARAYLVAIGDMTAREAVAGLQQAIENFFLEIGGDER
jgi:hypothetical protein